MDIIKLLFDLTRDTAIVSIILAVVLVYSAKNLAGKKWLLASVIITSVMILAFPIIHLISQYLDNTREVYQWYQVFHVLSLFGTACFEIFLFIIWSNSRMKVDVKELIFSFNGRIPRSVFWILASIIFPLNAVMCDVLYTLAVDGLPKLIVLIISICWLILGTWISLAIYAKRWHDCSKSGWMTLILFIPVIGAFWFLGYLGFARGTQGSNTYGDNPLEIKSN